MHQLLIYYKYRKNTYPSVENLFFIQYFATKSHNHFSANHATGSSQDTVFRNTVPRLIIDGNEIDNVQYAKLFGVTIYSDLTWNKHVENIVAKAGKRVCMLGLYQLKRSGIGQHDLVTI